MPRNRFRAMRVGWMPYRVPLGPGDQLLLYTDVTEARDHGSRRGCCRGRAFWRRLGERVEGCWGRWRR